MRYNKDHLTFRIIDTNPTKGTVTLRPTFGTLIKLNIVAVGLLYVGKLMVDWLLDDQEDRIVSRLRRTETPSKETE